MKRKSTFMTGAAAAALIGGIAMATPAMADPIPQAASYGDLFEPVAGAEHRLAADDAAQIQTVQDWRYRNDRYRDHHHHHHQRYDRRYYESRGYYWNGWGWARRPVHYHHHHHHHHQNYYYDNESWR
jgi:hypothetical protein